MSGSDRSSAAQGRPSSQTELPACPTEAAFSSCVRWNKVISGGAFNRMGEKVVPTPLLTYRWDVLIRYNPSGYGVQ